MGNPVAAFGKRRYTSDEFRQLRASSFGLAFLWKTPPFIAAYALPEIAFALGIDAIDDGYVDCADFVEVSLGATEADEFALFRVQERCETVFFAVKCTYVRQLVGHRGPVFVYLKRHYDLATVGISLPEVFVGRASTREYHEVDDGSVCLEILKIFFVLWVVGSDVVFS